MRLEVEGANPKIYLQFSCMKNLSLHIINYIPLYTICQVALYFNVTSSCETGTVSFMLLANLFSSVLDSATSLCMLFARSVRNYRIIENPIYLSACFM
jgi:hypothetical protein